MERLTRETSTFSKIDTLRSPVTAHFGQNAEKPLLAITEIYSSIIAASLSICELRQERDLSNDDPVWEVLGRRQRPDAVDKALAGAIGEIEAICKPVLSEMPPS
jgi:hypothetical protein